MRDASRVRVAVAKSNRRHGKIGQMAGDLTGPAARCSTKDFLMKPLIPIACVLVLEACGTTSAVLNPVSPAEVAALEEAVTIADTLALNYTRLPTCPNAAPACSVAAIKQSIKGYAQQAHDSMKTLQSASAAGAPAALAAAQVALAALEASIPAVPAVAPPAASPHDSSAGPSIGPWGAPFGTAARS